MKVLVINTYGGSLLVGAKLGGHEIVGSYEDTGFGTKIQQENFPDLDYVERLPWPKRDLSDVVVIAHPPCSAFSVQNPSWFERGTKSNAFACTKRILDYGMRGQAKAIAVESVVGACGGAYYTHQEYADKYGYHLYRILHNGCMFQPQWRERFWAVFVRKDGSRDTSIMRWTLKPRWQVVRDVTEGYEDGESFPVLDSQLEKFKERIRPVCSDEDMAYFFEPQDPPHPTTGVLPIFLRRLFPNATDSYEICKKYISTYSSGMMVYLDPNGLAGVLMGGTWWYMDGRNVAVDAYKRIMGFPADYKYPERYKNQVRVYLSKGVIPQVAGWVLRNIEDHFENFMDFKPYTIDIYPSEIADFRIDKKDWKKRHEALPQLRHYQNRHAIVIPNHDRMNEIVSWIRGE